MNTGLTPTSAAAFASASASGLVLAGGKSSRFGSDKSRFRVHGVEMRVHVGRVLRQVVPRVGLSVGADSTGESDETGDAWPFDARVEDIFSGRGPLAGIHAGLKWGVGEFMLVAPCDMPDLTSRSLEKLLIAAQTTDTQAVVAEHDGRLVAVLGCFRRSLAADVSAILADPRANTGVEAFVRSLDRWSAVRLPPSELRNVNEAHDVR